MTLGIPFANIRRWKREYEAGHFNEGFVAPVPRAESLETSRLKKELLDVQLEGDILKKAVAIQGRRIINFQVLVF